jgi:hypothetical protein
MYFAIFYSRLSLQLTIGRMGLSCLCNFIAICICGALGFMLMYFHLLFVFITLLHFFMSLRMFCCSLFVMSCGNFVKLFLVINSSILFL